MKLDDFIDAVALAGNLDRAQANDAIEAVLEALRDRLSYRECAHLASWLPTHLRRFVLKSRRHSPTRLTREEFVERVCLHLGVDVAEALRRIRAVYAVLERLVGTYAPAERAHVMGLMPPELRKVLKPPAMMRT